MAILQPPATDNSRIGETWFALMLFCGALVFHGWGAGVGWQNHNLPGLEFRQTQTALSAYFIQRDHDFRLAYPTPVLGKPWSVPMEFPLYQWTVVGLSNASGLDLTKAGRVVSLACLYLSLPALYILLGLTGLAWTRRLIALSFLLSCPLYILYGRAFLIETMALFFSVWFLVAYLRAVERKSVWWLVIASVAGSGAGLVKVTTFLFVLMPVFAWSVSRLWNKRPGTPGGSWRATILFAGWALGAVALPCVAAVWWVRFADAAKALNPAADFLGSERMMGFNFGTNQTRFSAEIWGDHLAILFKQIVRWWALAGAAVLGIFFARRHWDWIAYLVGCFVVVQLVFPVLYALHDYYYVANAFTLLLAVGLAAVGPLESRMPLILAYGAILVLQAGQVWSYFEVNYPLQREPSIGGSPITQALQLTTGPDDVLIVAGQDWCSNTPFYARRRALMFRSGMESDDALITSTFASLQGETVGALVLAGPQRDNRKLLDSVVQRFELDPRPVFESLDATVYYHRRRRLAAVPQLMKMADAQSVHLTAESVADADALIGHEVEIALLPPSHAQKFADMSPQPFKYFATYGIERQVVDGREMLFTHPVTRLWFRADSGKRTIRLELELIPGAYAESVAPGDRSDGIGVSVSGEGADGARRLLFLHELNPRDRLVDRGLQTIVRGFDLKPGEVVVLEVGPGVNNSANHDWAMLGRIELK